jgi:two-component system CheB/CheR fusion protein
MPVRKNKKKKAATKKTTGAPAAAIKRPTKKKAAETNKPGRMKAAATKKAPTQAARTEKTRREKSASAAQKKSAGKTAPPEDNAGNGKVAARKAVAEPGSLDARERTSFPIVGVGASAGGLEALQEFFNHMPVDAGMGFVIVTHMHREHTSVLPELLARTTGMPVVEATDGQDVEPDHVYVAPPGDDLTIKDGVLKRKDHQSDVKLPIDHFLRALADDQREHAICVILSGTGTDGTLGLRAIKGEAGMAMVQTTQSAKFAGMPSSAESTGLVDYTLSPADMPGQLVAYVEELRNRTRIPARAEPEFPPESLRQILGVLRMRTGNDFASYKTSTIRRRIERRMNVHRIKSPDDYARFLKENKHEANLLFRELLITVTSFFRDPDAFEALADCLPDLLQARGGRHTLRAWVPGCATGEEAYSVAIVLHECMARLDRALEAQVFATDLDPRAIETGRSGVYASGIAADVSKARIKRYFTHDHDTYRVNKEVREMVIFAPQNVLSDPPFTRLDLIVCRNLLIYFGTEQQKRLLPMFHYALRPGGLLFLGPSETIGPLDDLFALVDRKWKIYRRKETVSHLHPGLLEIPTRPIADLTGIFPKPGQRRTRPPRSEGQIQRLLLARFAPTCLVVDDSGDIIHIHGRTGMYLEPSEGEPSHNVLEMAREGLAASLTTALRRASNQKRTVTRTGVTVKANGEKANIDVNVIPIEEPEPLRGLFLITFRPADRRPGKRRSPAPPGKEHAGRVAELEEDLRHSQESLQSTIEELESANEELKSANEELQSMNEELQSTNEELETSKEEMQSLNEELSTVNAELNSKIEELSHANDDMQNLLNGIDVASVFLDESLRIKRYTEQARELIHLVPGDVGRPLEDLALHVEYPHLIEDCRNVLKTLDHREDEILSDDGKWLMMRILPYRTSQNVIDGVAVTFVPIDELKRAESDARNALHYFEQIVQTVREPLVVLESDLTVRSANQAFYHTFEDAPSDVEGRRIYELDHGRWDIPWLRELLKKILPEDVSFNDFEVEHDCPRLGRRRFLLNARRMEGGSGRPDLILLAMEDVTDREE